MATRNRTIVFKKYSDALKSVRAPTSSAPSTSAGGGLVIELVSASLLNQNRSYAPLSTDDPSSSRVAVTVGLPPAWVDTSEEIVANIQRARTKMAELMKAHAKALMPSFGDGKAYQRRIEALTHEITDLFKKSEKLLKKLSSGGPSEDSNIRKNVQRSIATDLQNLLMELRKKQSAYLKRLRQQKEGSDGVDLEMNINGRSRTDEDEFDDVRLPSLGDFDYSEEDDMLSDEDLGTSKTKKARKIMDPVGESRKELAVTTRQRALQTGKDVSTSGGSLLEFPNGLPPAPPRKQKEKLSELEQQLKRAEALQKRRMQVEKANQELEAEAIRKILGQDSSRKKRENQIKKRQEELAQERAANAMKLAPNIVRWTSGLNGMLVTFPEEMALPSLFKQEKPSYPPPREKCAGPSCPNTYKYRCSKTKLPLCSLQCYKAVQAPERPSNACQ